MGKYVNYDGRRSSFSSVISYILFSFFLNDLADGGDFFDASLLAPREDLVLHDEFAFRPVRVLPGDLVAGVGGDHAPSAVAHVAPEILADAHLPIRPVDVTFCKDNNSSVNY